MKTKVDNTVRILLFAAFVICLSNAQLCLEFSNNKCIKCSQGTRLFRDNCLFNLPSCLDYDSLTGFDCIRCQSSYNRSKIGANYQCIKSISQSISNTQNNNLNSVQNEANFQQILKNNFDVNQIDKFLLPILNQNFGESFVSKAYRKRVNPVDNNQNKVNQYIYRVIYLTRSGLVQIQMSIFTNEIGLLNFSTFKALNSVSYPIIQQNQKQTPLLIPDIKLDQKYNQIKNFIKQNYAQFAQDQIILSLKTKTTQQSQNSSIDTYNYRLFIVDINEGLKEVLISFRQSTNIPPQKVDVVNANNNKNISSNQQLATTNAQNSNNFKTQTLSNTSKSQASNSSNQNPIQYEIIQILPSKLGEIIEFSKGYQYFIKKYSKRLENNQILALNIKQPRPSTNSTIQIIPTYIITTIDQNFENQIVMEYTIDKNKNNEVKQIKFDQVALSTLISQVKSQQNTNSNQSNAQTGSNNNQSNTSTLPIKSNSTTQNQTNQKKVQNITKVQQNNKTAINEKPQLQQQNLSNTNNVNNSNNDLNIFKFTLISFQNIANNSLALQTLKYLNKQKGRQISDVSKLISLQTFEITMPQQPKMEFIRTTQRQDTGNLIYQAVYQVHFDQNAVNPQNKLFIKLIIQRKISYDANGKSVPQIPQNIQTRNAYEDTIAIQRYLQNLIIQQTSQSTQTTNQNVKVQNKTFNLLVNNTNNSLPSNVKVQSQTKTTQSSLTQNKTSQSSPIINVQQQNKTVQPVPSNTKVQSQNKTVQSPSPIVSVQSQNKTTQSTSPNIKTQVQNKTGQTSIPTNSNNATQSKRGIFSSQQLANNPSFVQVDKYIRTNFETVLNNSKLRVAAIQIKQKEQLISLEVGYQINSQTYMIFYATVTFKGAIDIQRVIQTKNLDLLKKTSTEPQKPNESLAKITNIQNSSADSKAITYYFKSEQIIPLSQLQKSQQFQIGVVAILNRYPQFKNILLPSQISKIIQNSSDGKSNRIVYKILFRRLNGNDFYEGKYLISLQDQHFQLLSFEKFDNNNAILNSPISAQAQSQKPQIVSSNSVDNSKTQSVSQTVAQSSNSKNLTVNNVPLDTSKNTPGK